MATTPNRRAYIDWMRGLSVLFMIEIHSMDSWTSAVDHKTFAYFVADFIGGLAAPMFLFLAGVSVAMAGAARERRTGDRRLAAWSVQKRGWEIFGLAFLFRLQTYLLSPGATIRGIFKADILNIMGPAIAAAAFLWGRLSNRTVRLVTFAVLAAAFTGVTPLVRLLAWPDTTLFGWYIKPLPKMSVFTLFPWTGFVFAGAIVGEILNSAATSAQEWRLNRWNFVAGVALVAGGYGAAFLPSPYPPGASNFWTTSPAYFFIKLGIMLMLMSAIYLYVQRPWSAAPVNPQTGPMLEFGRASLFVYWIHVELAYGVFSHPLHQRLAIWQSLVAFVVFATALYFATVLKGRVAASWRTRRATAQTA
ncbi:MAG: heparan-alpha-glucosaminide N-acetyltransferase domain-containing protein [Acidobacteriota bacterium]